MASIREKLAALKANIPTAEVVVKGVGTVKLIGLTAGARDQWEQFIYNSRGTGQSVKNVRASLVCRCIAGEDGGRAYTDSVADMDEVSALPAKVVDQLYKVAQKLSGLGADDIDELEKA